MARARRSDPPVDIVLTEEDLAVIIRESGEGRAAGGWSFAAGPPAAPSPSPLPAPGERAWNIGASSPGAVGEAIRMILDATTLGRGKRMKAPGND